ncbi:uncharacterized protein LOC121798566 [Salvia splendens]|uniref:uncharacterized protein LOC121798566 n=1 Tax=Salvia splendens TaxID=180675 RepID=UPI001C262766|nr:uncharacterized protein LOC121798566 [Salvia splendens]
MGNCQAVEAAALVIQHPCGKLERMYWPISATDVMKTNPGHYVSLIIPNHHNRTVRLKLLRPTDTLLLGRAYRLLTTQEVMRVVRAKSHAKMKRSITESEPDPRQPASETNHDEGDARLRHREGGGRSRSWRPSLQSISEAASSSILV